jgi:hypothetical protein
LGIGINEKELKSGIFLYHNHIRAPQTTEHFGGGIIAVTAYHADFITVAETVDAPVAGNWIVNNKVFAVKGITLDDRVMPDRIVVVLSE